MLSRCSIFASFSLALLVGQVDSGPPANQLLKLVIQEARYRQSRGKRQSGRWYPPPRSYRPVLILAVCWIMLDPSPTFSNIIGECYTVMLKNSPTNITSKMFSPLIAGIRDKTNIGRWKRNLEKRHMEIGKDDKEEDYIGEQKPNSRT